jgi:cell division transport system permease protein|tara:strand:+ start:546 stop:1391 length:846 start_codon:yes stop_codon:yes gene_type:complete
METKKVRSNLISIFLINTFVLFTLSFIALIYFKSSSVESYFKENILVNIYLKNSTKDAENKKLTKFLNLNNDVKEITYLSKEDAAKNFSNEIGEEFVGFLGYNPLLDAISVKLYSEKIDVYSIEKFIKNIINFEFIEEVEYDKPLVDALNNNFEKIGYWILILSVIFFITSFILINYSIKISIYSKKEVIKTMQLVGATSKFIRRPFILTYVKIGFMSSIISIILLLLLIFQLNTQVDEINFFADTNDLIVLTCFITFYGVSTSFISSFFVTQRYLKLKFI